MESRERGNFYINFIGRDVCAIGSLMSFFNLPRIFFTRDKYFFHKKIKKSSIFFKLYHNFLLKSSRSNNFFFWHASFRSRIFPTKFGDRKLMKKHRPGTPSLKIQWGPLWPWSYDSWIYNYLCNQCLSPLMLWVRISITARCTTLCDKVCQWLATDRWFSPCFLHQ